MHKLILLLGVIFFTNLLDAQIIIDNSIDETEAVEDILLGAGVVASNIVFSGDQNQIGSFNSNGSILPLLEGVILGTGDVSFASGEGDGGNDFNGGSLGGGNDENSDPDLVIISGLDINDAAILEFDFVATGDSVKFNFIFASEEYPDYVCGTVNDAFGFFLSGPGIDGGGAFSDNAVNLATVPNSDPAIPVTINTVNPGTPGFSGDATNCADLDPNWEDNSIFYVANHEVSDDPNRIEYNGFTVTLNATAAIECGETYHIKMSIGDGGDFDTSFDSAVFLEASSFSSNQFNLELVQDLGFSANDSTLFENCGEPIIRITRPEDLVDEQSLTIELAGTAENGVDFEGVPTEIFFAQDQNVVEIPLTIYQDNIDEPLESLTISFETVSSCNNVSNEFTVYITDVAPISVALDDADSDCNTSALLVPEVTGGIGNYTYLWSDGTTTLENEVSPGTTTSYMLTVSDDCDVADAIASSEVTVPVYPNINLEEIDNITISCGEEINVFTTANGGFGAFVYEWDLNGTIIGNDQNLITEPSQGGTITATATDECGLSNTTSFELLFTPITVDIGLDLTIDCLNEYTITPVLNGAPENYSFEWEANGAIIGLDETLTATAFTTRTITLTITDACNEEVSDEMVLTVPEVPIIVSLPEDFGICLNQSADLVGSAAGGIGALTYRWEGTTVEGSALTVTPAETQTYNLIVNDVCENRGQESITVFVEDFEVGFTHEINDDNSIEFTNLTENASEILWDLSEGYNSTENSLTYSFDDIYQQHIVTLYGTSLLGCIDSTSHVFEPPTIVYIPSAFTPNGDGLNETFKVVGSSIAAYHILIFDRDGHMVYESKDINEVWDGSNQKGDYFVQDGVYTYYLTVKTLETEVLERKGHITILR